MPYNKFETAIKTIETIFKSYNVYSTSVSPISNEHILVQ